MPHPKKLQAMLDRLKWCDLAYTTSVFCEYQLKARLNEYEVEDESNFKRLYYRRNGNSELDAAMHELIKDKKITYLLFREIYIGGGYDDEEATEYKHPHYTEIFVCEDIDGYAEEITTESHAKLLFEIARGDYDNSTGEYLGYSGDYADFSNPV
jgi:hypothetical protein